MAPWGWECRARLVKQVALQPTKKRPTKWDGFITPGPGHYPTPEIFCGSGYSKIRRAPAYTFGMKTPVIYMKRAALPNAPQFNIRNLTRKGLPKIPQGIIAIKCRIPGDRTQKPGPGAHSPKDLVHMKRPPTYSMRIAAKPPYQPYDMWTPSSNMYWPPIPGKKFPAYSLGNAYRRVRDQNLPGPGEHDPKYDFVKTSKPAFSFGYGFREIPGLKTPAPNAYCEKRFMFSKRSTPAPSFGIRHSPYLGKNQVYEMPSKLEVLSRDLEP